MTDLAAPPPALADRRILVAGGTTGVGRAKVKALAAAGAWPMLLGRHLPEQQREAIARGEMLLAGEIAEGALFILTRSLRCEVAMLPMEPLRQKPS